MTTRLYCRECGWHPKFRRKRAAFRAAGRHHCTGTPVAETCPPWWFRLWTHLWTGRSDAAGIDTEVGADDGTGDGELVDARGNRIQWAALAAHHAETTRRARQAMVELVRAGYQIGPPPYGYRALRIRVTDPSGHSKLRAVLVPDWQTAAVVKQIFIWRADHGLKFAVIASRLNRDPRQYPAPTPNGRWAAKAVRRIVTNAKYTGRQVWARTVAGRPAPAEQWVTSAPKVHEPLVDERTFQSCPAWPRRASAWRDESGRLPAERSMTTRRWTLAAAVLFAGYAATIAGANWASTLWPAVAVAGLQIPAGAFFAGLAFTVRDLLQEAVGTRTTLLAIAVGAALSGLVAEPRIALASAAAFAVSELVDLAAYTPLRRRSRIAAVALSNAVGLLVDSLLFLSLAFGSLTYLAGQLVGKTATTVIAVAVLVGTRARRRAVPA